MSQGSRQVRVTAALPEGVGYHPAFLTYPQQTALLAAISHCLHAAPPFEPVMPRTGKPFSVTMSNCGQLGWVSDRAGYRYQPQHPVTKAPWPPIPSALLELWRALSGTTTAQPEACLINFYDASAKMGSHQDRDEADTSCPVVSVSLGDDAVFHIGGITRTGPKTRITLRSGDVLTLGGPSRHAFHGLDRLVPGTSPLALGAVLPGCRRINLTLRRVTRVGTN